MYYMQHVCALEMQKAEEVVETPELELQLVKRCIVDAKN